MDKQKRLAELQEIAVTLILQGLRKQFLKVMPRGDQIEFFTLYREVEKRCFLCGRTQEECPCQY